MYPVGNPDCYGSSKNAAESGQENKQANLLGRIDQRRRTRNQIKREISTLSKSARGFSNTARNECVGESAESVYSVVKEKRQKEELGRAVLSQTNRGMG